MRDHTYIESLKLATFMLETTPQASVAKLLMIEFFLPVDDKHEKRLKEVRFWSKIAMNLARCEARGELYD